MCHNPKAERLVTNPVSLTATGLREQGARAERERIREKFHKAWGEARGDSDERPEGYDKNVWMTIQRIIEGD